MIVESIPIDVVLSFRVFETVGWTYEQWNLDSPLQDAVWSPDGEPTHYRSGYFPISLDIIYNYPDAFT